MLQPSPSMTFGELCSKQYAAYVSFIFFIPVVAGAKIQYIFRKLHFLRAGSKKGQYIKPELRESAFGLKIIKNYKKVDFRKQFWRINATKCIDKGISRKNEAIRSEGSTQIWEDCGKS